jgi:hypothetical protein
MENDKKMALEDLVETSSLSQEDKGFWKKMIASSPAEFMETLAEVLEMYPQELPWFNDIFKRKQAAFALFETDKEKGMEELRGIYQEEKEKMDELISK